MHPSRASGEDPPIPHHTTGRPRAHLGFRLQAPRRVEDGAAAADLNDHTTNRYAGAFEANLGRRQAIRMRRIDLLEPLRVQLTAQSYLDLRATLGFEVRLRRG